MALPPPAPTILQAQLASILTRAANMAEALTCPALRDKLATAEAEARHARSRLLGTRRHSRQELRDIEANVRAITECVDAIQDDQRRIR